MKIVQATHHQDDIKYGMLMGIQCSRMSLISVCYAWGSFDLNCIVRLAIEVFCWKFFNKCRISLLQRDNWWDISCVYYWNCDWLLTDKHWSGVDY